ncbi:helix-turn-helix domain-containing protein [Actinomadura sp. WMMB 499]
MVGAARESAVKAVRHMRCAGLIRTGYRRIVVSDLERLKAYAMTGR